MPHIKLTFIVIILLYWLCFRRVFLCEKQKRVNLLCSGLVLAVSPLLSGQLINQYCRIKKKVKNKILYSLQTHFKSYEI